MEKLRRSNPYKKSACPTWPRFQEIVNFQTLIKSDQNMIYLENSVMFLECLKNNSKILSDVIIMQFGKGVLLQVYFGSDFTKLKETVTCFFCLFT